MPARTTKGANTRLANDPMADFDWDSWDNADVEDLSSDFGTKLKFGDKPGEITDFVGIFQGTKHIPNPDDADEIMHAAEFTDREGEKCYAWLTFALNEAITTEGGIAVGDLVRIEWKGRQPTKRGLNPVSVFEIKVKRSTKK